MINDKYYNRRYVISGIAVVVVLVYIIKLFVVQIIDQSTKEKADNNALVRQTVYPSRGLIYDRNGVLLVFNQRFIFVGENDVHILAYQGLKEVVVFVYDIVTCQVKRDGASSFFGEFHGFFDHFMVLHEISFEMEDVVSEESFFSQIYCYSVACIFLFHMTVNIGMLS